MLLILYVLLYPKYNLKGQVSVWNFEYVLKFHLVRINFYFNTEQNVSYKRQLLGYLQNNNCVICIYIS